ncbi:dTDP-4-dehydrorhamnose 3,5-epimerase family protein, partial [Enterococcus faecium]
MEVRPLGLDGVFEILPQRFGDDRGFFSETYKAKALREAGIDFNFVQDNHSYSAARGVVRGLHYQLPPFAQDKLLRVIRGAILDVAVDIRKSSPTFGRWVAQE